MKGKSKLAAACVLAAAAIFGACRADDTAELTRPDPGMSQPASKNGEAKPSPSVVAQAPAEEARRVGSGARP